MNYFIMTIIRLGQTFSGKILDRNTHWFCLETDKDYILNDENIMKHYILNDENIMLNKPIFISKNKTKYVEISYDDLVKLINEV